VASSVARCTAIAHAQASNIRNLAVNQTDFAIFLMNACANHEAGFHYYDHGYVGMALALHDEFERRGCEASLHIRLDVDHAYVFADGHFVDGQGRGRPEDQRAEFKTRETTAKELLDWAVLKGRTLEEIQADHTGAGEVVSSAIDLHSDYLAATRTFQDRYGIDQRQAEQLYWLIEEPSARRALREIAEGGFKREDFTRLRADDDLFLELAAADDAVGDLAVMDEEIRQYGTWVFFERLGKGKTFAAFSSSSEEEGMNMNALDDVIKYKPASTLREVVASALTEIDRTWDDVLGIAVLLPGYELPDELHDSVTGLVYQEKIDEALDFDVTANKSEGLDWPWGGSQDDLYNRFEMTVWLDDCVVKFEERYNAGSFIECRRIPTTPPSEYSYAPNRQGFDRP
jgi:hypothetical protein